MSQVFWSEAANSLLVANGSVNESITTIKFH